VKAARRHAQTTLAAADGLERHEGLEVRGQG
jgi:hypothetical protein